MNRENINQHILFKQPILSRIPKTAKRILDIGCETGFTGRQIKQNIDCEVIGITYLDSELKLASQWLDRVLLHDLNQDGFDLTTLGQFDCIICSHVLEHLYRPQKLLHDLHQILKPEGLLIVALPNVLFWRQRLEFFKGNFKYQDAGLMDRTHFRFFDWETAHELLEQNGYKIIESEADGFFPLSVFRQLIPKLGLKIDQVATKHFPGLFGIQFILICHSSY